MPNLVGIGLSQVPTNSMLGGLAYQNAQNTSIENLNLKNISSINSEIADTAVDVFVYDTSKDSDGGAWRKRTQNTSWYNETLGTATRGTRKEFPAVAVIVLTGDASTSQATIYDGDDPDLPMWMVIPDQTIDWANNSGAPTATAALNAKICITCAGSGIVTLDFIKDFREIYYSGNYTFRDTSIINRASSSYRSGSINGAIVNNQTKDVAMTVLPNAPIDDTTGLPVPTIAVATDGGTSIIKDDGTVVDMYVSGESDQCLGINFTDSNNLAIRLYTGWVFYYNIPSVDITTTYWNGLSGYLGRWTDTQRDWGSGTNGIPINVGANGITELLEDKAVGHTNGLDILYTDLSSFGNGMHAGISTDFNTGWQHGDIKGAFLSDTDTTDTAVAYSDGFSNNDKGWGFVDCSITSGNLVITQQSQARATDLDALDGIATGTKLVFTFTVSGSGTGAVLLDDDGAGAGVGGNTNYGSFSSTGSYIFTTTKTASPRLRFIRQNGSNDYEIAFLNITTEYDRSVNGKGLTSNGTVNKSVVATGAELVGYGPFSNANYVKQLYNSDMNFGTGDFSITWWHYMIGNVSNSEYVYDRAGGNGYRHAVYYITNDSGRMTFYTNASSTSEIFVNGINSYKDRWTCYTVTRSGSSGNMAIYINGELKTSSILTVRDLDNTSAELYIGVRHNETGAASQAKYALMRFSKSIPSAEQIKKMYNDEKVLFRPNAKATLHGSSDAVTALAYDEDTELLHVGTSAGRSDFQGLRRINNTTTAVTTAISAHDEFIIEQ